MNWREEIVSNKLACMEEWMLNTVESTTASCMIPEVRTMQERDVDDRWTTTVGHQAIAGISGLISPLPSATGASAVSNQQCLY